MSSFHNRSGTLRNYLAMENGRVMWFIVPRRPMHKFLLAVAASLLVACSSADAARVIRHDTGGEMRSQYYKYQGWKKRGERVVVDGDCVSACTMVLAVRNVCATSRARFGFHDAWSPTPGGPVMNQRGNAAFMRSFPARVKAFIRAHGGLSPRMIWASGRDLGLPACSARHAELMVMAGRRLGDEYRFSTEVELDPVVNWIERAKAIPGALETAV